MKEDVCHVVERDDDFVLETRGSVVPFVEEEASTGLRSLARLAADVVLVHHCRVYKDDPLVATVLSIVCGWDVTQGGPSWLEGTSE